MICKGARKRMHGTVDCGNCKSAGKLELKLNGKVVGKTPCPACKGHGFKTAVTVVTIDRKACCSKAACAKHHDRAMAVKLAKKMSAKDAAKLLKANPECHTEHCTNMVCDGKLFRKDDSFVLKNLPKF